MKNINNLIALSLKSLLKNKRRNFLTVFGIIIGISSVITIMSIGNGFKKDTLSKLNKNGDNKNVALVSYIENDVNVENSIPFKPSDISLVKNIKGVKNSKIKKQKSEEYNTKVSVWGQSKNITLKKSSVSSKVEKGSGFDKYDNILHRKVVTISQSLNKKLFNSDGLNETLFIDKQGFKVVGISSSSEITDVKIPDNTFDKYLTNIHSEMPQLEIQVSENANKKDIGKKAAKELNKYGSSLKDGKYQYSDPKETEELFGKILDGITYFIAAVASISLFISGVGVMNVMYISVSERTEEIAIRRAFGARSLDIEIQFLIESIVLCVVGGIIGLILGIIFSQTLSLLVPFIKSSTSIGSVIICIGVSMFIGILFGWIPAKTAASKELIKIIK